MMGFADFLLERRKIIVTVILLILALFLLFKPLDLNFFSAVDERTNTYLNSTITKATITYAGLRTMNAVISVIQSISVNASFKIPLIASGGGSISIGELFDPINDIIERCSVVVLFALASLGIQKILLSISPFAFKLILPLTLALLICGVWRRSFKGFDFRKSALKLAVFAIVIRFCIPFAAVCNDVVDRFVLNEKYETSRSEIVALESSLNEVKENFTISKKIKSTLETLKSSVTGKISYFVDTIIIFIFQTAVIPLIVLFLLVKFPGFIVNTLDFTRGSDE